jgi:DNA-binding LacI/PurR family transcriptional regulator
MEQGITLKDIARDLNVSITTVSKVFNNHPDISEKRKKEILDYAKQKHYVPNEVARSFRKGRSTLIGVILTDNTNPYNARIIKGIEAGLSEFGYHVIIMNNGEDVEKEMQMIKELHGMNVAGILLSPARCNKKSCEYLASLGIPYVLVNRYLDKEKDAYVIINDEYAAYNATNYLATYQHDKIFFFNYLPEVSSSIDRLNGYKRAIKANGLTFHPDYVIDSCIDQTDGYEATTRILKKYAPPFSVLCYSDFIAIGVLCALQEREFQSPSDVVIMGNDDIDILSFVKPRLSTVAVPKYRLGYKCAETIVDLITRKQDGLPFDSAYMETKRIVKKTEIIIRETS